jgi:hypothetical protein
MKVDRQSRAVLWTSLKMYNSIVNASRQILGYVLNYVDCLLAVLIFCNEIAAIMKYNINSGI